MGDRLATVDMGRKVGAAVSLSVGGAVSLSNIMWTGPRPTSVPIGVLIHPTVWPQYTNVADRETGQRSRSIGRTVTCNGLPKTDRVFKLSPIFRARNENRTKSDVTRNVSNVVEVQRSIEFYEQWAESASKSDQKRPKQPF